MEDLPDQNTDDYLGTLYSENKFYNTAEQVNQILAKRHQFPPDDDPRPRTKRYPSMVREKPRSRSNVYPLYRKKDENE